MTTIHMSKSVQEAMDVVHFSEDRGAVVVDSENRVVGIITEGDIMRALRQGVLLEARLTQIMQVNPRLNATDLPPKDFAREFADTGTLLIPIVDSNRRLVSIQRVRDSVRALLTLIED